MRAIAFGQVLESRFVSTVVSRNMGKRGAVVRTPLELAVAMANLLPKIDSATQSDIPASDRQANREVFIECLHELVELENSAVSCLAHLENRKEEKQKMEQAAALHPPMATVGKIPPAVMVSLITSTSDLTTEDVLNAKTQDPQADQQLFEFDSGLGMNQNLPVEGREKHVLSDLYLERSASMRSIIAQFKATGGICAGKGAELEVWLLQAALCRGWAFTCSAAHQWECSPMW